MRSEIKQKLLAVVKNNYETQAEDFSSSRQKLFWPEIMKLAAGVQNGARVLDMGCGQGRLLEVFSERSVDYLGMDQSAALIRIARTNYPERAFQVFNILDLDKLAVPDFDYIFSVAVLHHLPGADFRAQALKNLAAKLKPGGQIIISVWNLWARPKFFKLILKFAGQKIMGSNKMDFGDILFNWGGATSKANAGRNLNEAHNGRERYYHAFTFGGLKKISRVANLKIEKMYKDKFNYYLVLRKP